MLLQAPINILKIVVLYVISKKRYLDRDETDTDLFFYKEDDRSHFSLGAGRGTNLKFILQSAKTNQD
jgi:hypothetical protein